MNAVTKANESLPAHLQGGKTVQAGNLDNTDLIIPRVKLLQAISPEVMESQNGAKPGQFWHTIAGQTIGDKIVGIPIFIRKSFVLWSPRNDDRGILARASDGLNWDTPGLKFTVKPKGAVQDIVYNVGNTVHDKGPNGEPALSEFGSSIPGNPQSPPAAALTYQILWYFPEMADFSPAIIINTRSSVRPAKDLISKIEMRPVDHFAQKYIIETITEKGDEGPYFNYRYSAHGYADEQEYETCRAMYEKFKVADFRASDETEEIDKGEGGGLRQRGSGATDSSKF